MWQMPQWAGNRPLQMAQRPRIAWGFVVASLLWQELADIEGMYALPGFSDCHPNEQELAGRKGCLSVF